MYLEVEGLRLVLKEVKAQLVGQQHIVLHGSEQCHPHSCEAS